MKKVLFVCLGNICRSTMAEGVFKHLVKNAGLENEIFADSCGTANYHVGDNPDRRTMQTLEKYGITYQHKGRQVSQIDFETFDLILAMDNQNFADLQKLAKQNSNYLNKVFLMRDFDEGFEGSSVPDPYYGTMNDFEEVYAQVTRASQKILQNIVDKLI